MDVGSQKCKKCDFVSHSEGLLRKHRFQNHVLGFEIDLQKHIEVPKAMGDEVYTSMCDISIYLSIFSKIYKQ
jgi:hypothetical protein